MHKSTEIILPSERIETKIFFIRGKKVILDKDLALLYGVETRTLNQAVQRNKKRFPEDFMFKLNLDEIKIWAEFEHSDASNLRSQFVISSYGGRRYRPYVFTEQGIAMLSSVLKSERAIQVNIQIMRTFIKLRELLASNKLLREKIEKLEQKYDNNFKTIFKVIKQLLAEEEKPKRKIGFKTAD